MKKIILTRPAYTITSEGVAVTDAELLETIEIIIREVGEKANAADLPVRSPEAQTETANQV